MNEQITIKELFSLDKTIATGIFEGAVYPWEVLSKIGDYIVELGNSLRKRNITREVITHGYIRKQQYLTRLI